MSQTAIISVIAGVVSGAASAGVVVLLIASEPSQVPVDTLLRTDTAAWETSIVALQEENDLLRDRIEALELVRPNVRASADTSELDAARTAIQELELRVSALQSPGTVQSDELRANVTEAVSELRAREEKDRDERRQEAQTERLEEQLADLASKLKLDNYQLGEMRTTLQTSNEKRTKAFQSARDSGDFGSMRETMRTLRTETDEALAKFLTPEQVVQYDELRGQERGGRGFGRSDFAGRGGSTDRSTARDGF